MKRLARPRPLFRSAPAFACALLLVTPRLSAQRPYPLRVPELPPDVSTAQIDAAAHEAGFVRARHPYHDRPNECGPEDWRSVLIPNGPGPGVSFVPACTEHDYCYMGDPSREGCDRRFLDDMRRICHASNLPGDPEYPQPGRRRGLTLEKCLEDAGKYYQGVASFGGDIHAASQAKQEQYALWIEAYLSTPALLFVFDVSGSMEEESRHQASLRAVEEILRSRMTQPAVSRRRPSAGVMVFGGDCSPAAVRVVSGITDDLAAVQRIVRTGIPRPAGGTPLSIARTRADEEAAAFTRANARSRAQVDIVLLSDGADTCGSLRPAGVYGMSTRQGQGRTPRYLTVGLGVVPGSAAERDLQYLASSTGGRYLPAASPDRLRRVFEQHLKSYQPLPEPSTANLSASLRKRFHVAAATLQSRDYRSAAGAFAAFVSAQPSDAAGHYNLALALEAAQRYRGAGVHYARYAQLAPGGPRAAEARRLSSQLAADYVEHRAFLAKVIESDLAYLQSYYQRLFNQDNASLAAEFRGFVQEKGEFYADLSDAMEIDEPWVEQAERNVGRPIQQLARRAGNPSFDRDAVSLLAVPIAHLEELVQALSAHRP